MSIPVGKVAGLGRAGVHGAQFGASGGGSGATKAGLEPAEARKVQAPLRKKREAHIRKKNDECVAERKASGMVSKAAAERVAGLRPGGKKKGGKKKGGKKKKGGGGGGGGR